MNKKVILLIILAVILYVVILAVSVLSRKDIPSSGTVIRQVAPAVEQQVLEEAAQDRATNTETKPPDTGLTDEGAVFEGQVSGPLLN